MMRIRSIESEVMTVLCNIIELWNIIAFKVFQNGFYNYEGQPGLLVWAKVAPAISSLFKHEKQTSTGGTISKRIFLI